MYTSFEKLAPDSKIWIYQSNKVLNEDEKTYINKALLNFCQSWESHGREVNASFKVCEDRFIVIAADCNYEISGCSIDKSVNIIKELENDLNIRLLDRTFVNIQDVDILKLSLSEVKKQLKEGILSPETLMFDTTITNLSDFGSKWKVPIKHSWLAIFTK